MNEQVKMIEKIKNEIRNYIIEKIEIEPDDSDFSDDINLYKYGYLDSVDSMSLVYFMEEKFNIKITKEDILLNDMQSINEMAKMVQKKLSNG